MSGYEFHSAAEEFPLLDEKRLADLAADIQANGQREPIRLYDGKIVDGRNRYLACQRVGAKPRFESLPDDLDPYLYVWSLNGERRDLVSDQRYLIWKSCSEKSEAWRAECHRIAEEANTKRAEALNARPRNADGTLAASASTTSGRTGSAPRGKGTAEKAKASKTNRGSVERMDKLHRDRPDLAKQVQSGAIKPTNALRQMKKDEVSQKVKELPTGKYRVLYADPPWAYNDSREGLGAGEGQQVDRASTAAKNHYPTMTLAELSALNVKSLVADDAVFFMWATFPLLPQQLEVVKAWGFKYKTAFVWDKQRGSFGHYHKAEAELLFVCTRGACTPDADERESQIQRWPRAEHSRKPEEARAMIDRLYPHGPRIELFARGNVPEGWHAWGNEADEAEVA